MAAGDAYVVQSAAVANGSFLDLQPTAGLEVVVHNIYVPIQASFELYWYDGTNTIKFDLDLGGVGGRFNQQFHCTNAKYVRVKNTSGSAQNLGADGIYTK